MEDAVPGRVTNLWFQFNETGEFISFCREYCGTAHAYMNATINVVTQEEYDEWVKSS
jgi:cytochrome c oxidase subunit 2